MTVATPLFREVLSVAALTLLLGNAPVAAQAGALSSPPDLPTAHRGLLASWEPAAPSHEVSEPRNWSVLPFVIYNPETSLAFGALYARVVPETDGSEGVRSSLLVNAQYTLKNQVVTGVRYEGRPSRTRLVLSEGSARLSWPDRFYAPGNRRDRDDYEEWTSRGVEARARFLWKAGESRLYVGPVGGVTYTQIVETEEGGSLDSGGVDGAEDHGLVGLGVASIWDSRDSPVYPRSGAFHALSAMGYRSVKGETRLVGSAEADLRTYVAPADKTVLAFRVRVQTLWGDVPFTQYAVIGGTSGGLRGLYESRYSDRSAAVAVAELRQSLFWRVGGVLFAGVGEVAPGLETLSMEGLHGAGGFGLRFALMPASGLNVGVDLAMGEGETNVYFLLGEVF